MRRETVDRNARRGTALLLGGLVFGVAVLVNGCATQSTDDYVRQIIEESLGDVPEVAGDSSPVAAMSSVREAPPPVEVVAPVPVPAPIAAVPAAKPVPETPPAQAEKPVVPAGSATVEKPVIPAPITPVPEPAPLKPSVPTIQPETVLWVSVEEDPSLNGRYLVNNASAIDFGYVGLVFMPDMTVAQAETALRNALEGRYLNRATVSVKIAKASYDQVGVMGAVDLPGDIKIGAGASITLSEALRRAGGLRGNRDSARVKVVRGGLRTPFGPAAPGDVYVLSTSEGHLQIPELYLRNNDLAYVFTYETTQPGTTSAGGKRVLLLGEVPRRGVVEFAENEPCTLMYLLFKIGGLPRFARSDRIQVVRTSKDGRETTFLINGDDLMNQGDPKNDIVLESGDRVVVPARRFAIF